MYHVHAVHYFVAVEPSPALAITSWTPSRIVDGGDHG